jgi:hypothetical protein
MAELSGLGGGDTALEGAAHCVASRIRGTSRDRNGLFAEFGRGGDNALWSAQDIPDNRL